MNVNVFNTVTSARVLSYRWVLHYFSTIPVGGIKIVTIYKRSIFQVEWLIATLILFISHCSESDSVSSRVFYSAVSTAPRFLLIIRRSQSNNCIVFIFVSFEEKGYYCVVSIGQLTWLIFDCRSYCGLSRRMQGGEVVQPCALVKSAIFIVRNSNFEIVYFKRYISYYVGKTFRFMGT